MSADQPSTVRRRAFMTRLQQRLTNGVDDQRPHFVICGGDALAYTLADELSNAGHRIRITLVVPSESKADVPDVGKLRGVRVVRAERLDEQAFRAAGLAGAAALALVMPDDVTNLHAALCAQAVERDLRLVIRMFNTGLGYGVKRLFEDCAVLSDAAMAAPAFVAAALGEPAPTHFRHAGRTMYVARREDVPDKLVVCPLTVADGKGDVEVLPNGPLPDPGRPHDLVLAEASGRPAGQTVAARKLARSSHRPRPFRSTARAIRAALNRKLGMAVLITLVICAVAGAVLAHADEEVGGFWASIYTTLMTAVGSSDADTHRSGLAQAAQLVLTISGLALLPLITAAVVEGMVNARLALSSGQMRGTHEDHIVLVGLGSVGTRVLRQLVDLGLDVVAIDRNPNARGAKVTEQLGVPFIVGDAALEETLQAASIETAKALVVVSTDDVTNLQA
ncbi:NAD-binding protein, partial [Actinoplanes sp. NPDC051633]|uniref:potassium channel family protein n=1 Tax=Actinoplanes sp. NPDC051633 TaxID=3155670 RepID=UPI003437F1E3